MTVLRPAAEYLLAMVLVCHCAGLPRVWAAGNGGTTASAAPGTAASTSANSTASTTASGASSTTPSAASSTAPSATASATANGTTYQSTSVSEVEIGNPIKLKVEEQAPSFDLPKLTGPLSLDEAVNTAIKNNLNLQQSEQSWIASKFMVRSALGNFGPAASFHTWYSVSSLGQMLFYPARTWVYPQTMQPIVKGSSLALLFAGTQPLYTGGRLMGGYRAAKARSRQSLASYQEEKLATALKVKEAYWNAAWTEARLRVDSDYAKFREWSTANMKERLLQGKVPKADYLRERAALAKARLQINEDYRDFNTALLDLKVAMGLNIGSQISLRDSLKYDDTEGDVSGFLAAAQKNRPEIRRARARVDEMRASKLVARSRYSPEIGLYGAGSNITGSSPDGRSNGSWGGFIGIMGGITLFDSGQRRSELRAANADLRKAAIASQNAELNVAKEVGQAWIDLDLARRNIDLAKEEEASAAEDKRLFQARYMVGKSIALEYFDATVELFRAKLAVLESIYKYRIAQARLERASGKI